MFIRINRPLTSGAQVTVIPEHHRVSEGNEYAL